ncbi:hypothetical protein GDO86_001610, partial [Hymenochirus boettgeri]
RSYGQSAKGPEDQHLVHKGAKVQLNCTYKSGSTNLFWYVQYPDKTPEMLLYNYIVKEQRGFTAKQEKSDFTFNLYKDQAELTDTGVYYCAESDTVYQTDLIPDTELARVSLSLLSY